MPAQERSGSVADSFYRLPHPMTYVLASGPYWRAACSCHLNLVIGSNPYAKATR